MDIVEEKIIDLRGDTSNCKDGCRDMFKAWHEWISATKNFGGIKYSNKDFFKHNSKAAFILVPEKHEDYLKSINNKDRYMIRKAYKNGYVVQEINYNDYLDDIYAVNTSKQQRQGKLMTEGYRMKLKPSSLNKKNYCDNHFIKYYGVLKDGKLYAWLQTQFMNEIAIMNSVLGHGKHLTYGIMNALMDYLVQDCIKYKHIRYINYLTLVGCSAGLRNFKKSTGFKEYDFKFKNNLC